MQRITNFWKSGIAGKVIILAGSLFTLCCACLGTFSVIGNMGFVSTSTPMPTTDLNLAIQNTAQAILFQGFTQTALAIPPATITSVPSSTAAPVIVDTATSIPTFTLVPTLAVVIPTNPPVAGGVCSCSSDTLNCSDFSSYSSANACFNYCISVGAGDIHRLDGNNDGSACDSLK
jgi:hypothetical protein